MSAYQYTLEWGEMPLTYDLFTPTVKRLKLKDQVNIKALKFKRIDDGGSLQKQYLRDAGYISPNKIKY